MLFQCVCCLRARLSAALAYPADERDPMTIIEETTTHILQTLDSRREEFTADPQLLRDVVRDDLLPLIDLDYSARLILGKAGRGVSPEQLGAFSEAMSSVLINRYADGLIEFRSDEQLEVLPMKGNNTDKLTRVRTRIKLENGGFAPVDYSFRKTEQGWKAFDVTVEGYFLRHHFPQPDFAAGRGGGHRQGDRGHRGGKRQDR